MKPRIAIICRPDDRSPKILAQGLQDLLIKDGYTADIFFDGIGLLGRLFPLNKKIYNKIRFHYRLRQKLWYYFKDRRLLKKLGSYDAIILSECIPNAYWRGYYAIEELRERTGKPVCLYEVYYLGNSKTHTDMLKNGGHHGLERFDWNFSVSDVAEMRSSPSESLRWSVIGLNLGNTSLSLQVKDEFIVLVDFLQPGYESSRKEQLEVLRELNIKTIELEGRYSVEQIRELYKKASVLLVQFPESFGLPIAECLSTGTCVLVREQHWAMSWRKQDAQSGGFYLPDCFVTYKDREGLKQALTELRKEYHSIHTPQYFFNRFTAEYPHFWEGDRKSLTKAIHTIAELPQYAMD